MKRMSVVAWCLAGLLSAGATRAEAQAMGVFKGYLTGAAGWATSGDVSSPTFMPGLAVSVQETNGWGAEFDFGYAADTEAGPQQLDLATYMFNFNWIQPHGRLRPTVAVGAGAIQADGCNAPCTRPAKTFDLGVNLGGGAFYTVNDVVALRGDVRYFRTLADHPDLQRPDDLGFWRVSVGVTFLWAIVP
jgi:opacity protein-like surface antigen